MSDAQSYTCGCVNEPDTFSGVLKSISKCAKHKAAQHDPSGFDLACYKRLGAIKEDGTIRTANYLAELSEALGAFPPALMPDVAALEIGCGISPYYQAIEEVGYIWIGIDPSPHAKRFMLEKYGAHVIATDFETYNFHLTFDLILAAHSIEHMCDAPTAIQKCSDLLEPGGELWIIVPDDSDPTNQDHLWFFTPETLRACVERAGLTVELLVMRKYVPHEHFIYCRARKPT